jgi:hypothetical protein
MPIQLFVCLFSYRSSSLIVALWFESCRTARRVVPSAWEFARKHGYRTDDLVEIIESVS